MPRAVPPRVSGSRRGSQARCSRVLFYGVVFPGSQAQIYFPGGGGRSLCYSLLFGDTHGLLILCRESKAPCCTSRTQGAGSSSRTGGVGWAKPGQLLPWAGSLGLGRQGPHGLRLNLELTAVSVIPAVAEAQGFSWVIARGPLPGLFWWTMTLPALAPHWAFHVSTLDNRDSSGLSVHTHSCYAAPSSHTL